MVRYRTTFKKRSPARIIKPRKDTFDKVEVSVVDPRYFSTDPDPQTVFLTNRSESGAGSLTFKTPTKN
jgi:hypothetical protein